MRSRVSATHLLRHLVLFCLIGLFILTFLRAAYVLWQYQTVIESKALISVFVMGLRFDLALIGMIVLPALVAGGVLGLFKSTRTLAKITVLFILMSGLIFIVFSELITPYFLAVQGVRPDWRALQSISDPASTLNELWSNYFVPILIALVLSALIIKAYAQRLEFKALLRKRLRPLSTLVLLVVGTGLCLLAIYSGTDFTKPPLSPLVGLISENVLINEIALNSGFKLLYSIFT